MPVEKIHNVPMTALQFHLVKQLVEFNARHGEEFMLEPADRSAYEALEKKMAEVELAPTVSFLAYDWVYRDEVTGEDKYARTPERAEQLADAGYYITQVYTRHVDFPKG